MKRSVITTLCLLIGLITGVHAQRHCDIDVLPLIGPANNSDYSCNSTVVSGYYFVNRGPDVLQSTDKLWIFDPNVNNDSLGATANDPDSWYYYTVFPTGTVLNGVIGEGDDAVEAPHINIAVGDTILYFKWDDTITRLHTLIKYPDSTTTAVDGSTIIDNWYYKPTGTNLPANGTYLWAAYFLRFDTDAVVDTNATNDRKTSKITINCTTGINDLNYKKVNLSVYPNPTNSSINFNYDFLKAANVSARIMDLSGRTIKLINLGKTSAGNNKFVIQINELPTGTYLLEFSTEDSKGIAKFTKN